MKKPTNTPKTVEQQGVEKEVVTTQKTPEAMEDFIVVKSDADFSSATDDNYKEIDKSDKESKEALKVDEQVKEKVISGEAGEVSASQASELQKPMVAELNTGRPVYETASQAMAALAASGKIVTEK